MNAKYNNRSPPGSLCEYKYDFKPSAYTLDCHISLQSLPSSLLRNWSATGRSEGFGNITGLKFDSAQGNDVHTMIFLAI